MKNVMARAWEIARKGAKEFGGKVVEYLSESLKLAWKEVKEMKYNIEKLEEMGARVWEKGGHKRLYLNEAFDKLVGLEVDYYNTGNIRTAKYDGEKISNSEAYRIKNGQYFIDLNKDELVAKTGARTEGIAERLEEALLAL